ncbi:MAG: hypothetical protein QXO59_05920 [Candidatus Jordarchaeales archaeon]
MFISITSAGSKNRFTITADCWFGLRKFGKALFNAINQGLPIPDMYMYVLTRSIVKLYVALPEAYWKSATSTTIAGSKYICLNPSSTTPIVATSPVVIKASRAIVWSRSNATISMSSRTLIIDISVIKTK